MKLTEFIKSVEAKGITVAEEYAQGKQTKSYLVYEREKKNQFFADGVEYFSTTSFIFYLFELAKHEKIAEKDIIEILNSNNISYSIEYGIEEKTKKKIIIIRTEGIKNE